MDYAKESLRLHGEWKGKIEINAAVPVSTKEDLALAYTPGVAAPCLEIQKDVRKSYELTRRHNLCAVITDGSAVLSLGHIGPEAGMPVMEGKCVLFKAFGDVDAFPLCVKTKDVDEFVKTVSLISGSFGGINLEDISAPRCFEIERKLKETCDIPVFHDDQHGTAVIVLAGLINALKVVGKKKEDVKVVTIGAGAAGMGNAAMDVARTALRSGSRHVTLYSPTKDVAASSQEKAYAELDGAEFVFGKQIVQIAEKGPVFKSAIFDEQDHVIGYSEQTEQVEVDSIIISISQVPRHKLVRTTVGLEAGEHGTLIIDENHMTTLPGVFAAGDVVTGPKTVVHAVDGANKAAEAMIRYMENQ